MLLLTNHLRTHDLLYPPKRSNLLSGAYESSGPEQRVPFA
jgi:hypothetical protein